MGARSPLKGPRHRESVPVHPLTPGADRDAVGERYRLRVLLAICRRLKSSTIGD
ncbi:hypothetical protein BN2537_16327 [Streptomyces venezuelae]|nr:hypothetical protein BN2537_16327 [Streptomyces venezuelae]